MWPWHAFPQRDGVWDHLKARGRLFRLASGVARTEWRCWKREPKMSGSAVLGEKRRLKHWRMDGCRWQNTIYKWCDPIWTETGISSAFCWYTIAWSLSMWGMNLIHVFHSWAGRVWKSHNNCKKWLDSFGSFLAVNGYFVPWVDAISVIWGIVGNGYGWYAWIVGEEFITPQPPRKWTNATRKGDHFKTRIVFQPTLFRGNVGFPRCNFWRTSTFGTGGVVTR